MIYENTVILSEAKNLKRGFGGKYMNYQDILDEFKKSLPKDCQWWPEFFYHFTDAHNAASIIDQGWIYSRAKADKESVMANDNASKVVIETTNSENKIYGRLYFRPLTPTQYHNEGFKPEGVRNKDINASCPIPIFFLLSVEKTMQLEGVKFAERGISGNRHNIQSGEEEFAKLNFSKIYHNGFYDSKTNGDIKEYRQSEVICEGGFPVQPTVRVIMCRSNAERETLLYLLKRYSLRVYEAYKKIIMYKPSQKMFCGNGIFIKEVSVVDNSISLELNSKKLRVKNSDDEVPFSVKIEVTYIGANGQSLYFSEGETQMNYCTVENIGMKLDSIPNCTKVLVKVKFDEEVMYENELVIADDVIW